MRALLPAVVALLAAAPGASAAPSAKRVGSFDEPVYAASPPGAKGTLAVVERYGLVKLLRRGRVARRPLADLRSRVLVTDPDETTDQRGLFSLAFAPDYARSGRFYVDYVDRSGHLRVDELRRGRRAVRRVLDLGIVSTQHHGGQLQFGPDGLLYVSTGIDDSRTASGALLRLDPRDPGAGPERYATGLRNPWRFSFDRATGALLIGDVGESGAEEVNVLAPGAAAGANFGWPSYEGTRRRGIGPELPAHTPPALELRHPDGWCSITGGYVARGRYLFADLCSGRLWSARLAGARLLGARPLGVRIGYPVSFGQDGHGRVHVMSFNGGVYRLAGL